jgi:GNAT superfamily N-acetyltransferase
MSTITISYLEMRHPSELNPKRRVDDHFWVGEVTMPHGLYNRFLYMVVGGPWSWKDKLAWAEATWDEYASDPSLRTFVGYYDGAPAGYFELKRHEAGDVEIAYFGLVPAFIGKGLGGALLTEAIDRAWSWAKDRVWVHTCTLDHPHALNNYKARGMKVYRVAQKTI